VVTYGEFSHIQEFAVDKTGQPTSVNGLADIEKIIGAPGTLLSKHGDLSTYEWTNPDGSSVTVQFDSGLYYGKSQNGLKP
jgi:hypothetical protein